MWLFASVHLSVCLYRARAQNLILGSWGVKSEWKNLKFIVQSLWGDYIWAKKEVCMLCESSIKGGQNLEDI